MVVRGDRLARVPGDAVTITTLRDAAGFLGLTLTDEPGVGHDLPPYAPDADLRVDAAASAVLAAWYDFGHGALRRLADAATAGDEAVSITEAQLWPEHFDLAVIVTVAGGARTNVGFSPGDRSSDDPYVYVGPYDRTGLAGDYWNAPFGAVRTRAELASSVDADEFIGEGLSRLAQRR